MVILDAEGFPEISCYFVLNNLDWYWGDDSDYVIRKNFSMPDKVGIGPTILVEWEE